MLGLKGWATWASRTLGSAPRVPPSPGGGGCWPCLAALGHLGWPGLMLPHESLVGTCVHFANQLARGVRGRCAAGGPTGSLGYAGHAIPGGWGEGGRAFWLWLAEGRGRLWEFWGRGGETPFDL